MPIKIEVRNLRMELIDERTNEVRERFALDVHEAAWFWDMLEETGISGDRGSDARGDLQVRILLERGKPDELEEDAFWDLKWEMQIVTYL